MDITEEGMNSFQKDLSEFGICLSRVQREQFLHYYKLLTEWNSFMNLTAITEFHEVLKKHFVDSVSLIKVVPNISDGIHNLIDVGTGAGFPGVPLKIVFPDLRVTLLDSLNKRVQFLNEVINLLDLQNIEAIHGRAEDFARRDKLREHFDLCVSRAVASMSVLSEYCIPFVKQGGYFVAYKSENILTELDGSKKAIQILGGKYEKQIDFQLPNSDIKRNLVLIRKVNSTPLKFPRKAGLPSRDPI